MPAVNKVSPEPLSYWFDLPERNLSVYLDQSFVRDLQNSLPDDPAMGERTTGVLFGSITEGNQLTVVLEGFSRLRDWQVRKAKNRVQGKADGEQPIGLYEVRAGGPFAPARISDFDRRQWVWLQIEATPGLVPMASFSVVTGEPAGMPPDLRFVFDAKQLSNMAMPLETEASSPPGPSDSPVTPRLLGASLPRKPERPRLFIHLAIAGCLLGLVAAAYFVPSLIRKQPAAPVAPMAAAPSAVTSVRKPQPQPRLGVRVVVGRNQVDIGWDREAATEMDAVHGVLQVRDGNNFRDISLSRQQLTGGAVTYSPRTDDIDLRLQITDRSGDVHSETLKLVGAGEIVHENRFPALNATVRRGPLPTGSAPSPVNTSRPFQAPSQQTEAKSPELLPGPELAVTRPNWNSLPSAAPDGLPAPQAAAPSSPTPQPLSQGPVLLSRSPIEVPSSLSRYQKDKAFIVELRVTIDENGKVVAAEPRSASPGVYGVLAANVAQSVKRWKFAPARVNGVASRSDHDLQIVVRP